MWEAAGSDLIDLVGGGVIPIVDGRAVVLQSEADCYMEVVTSSETYGDLDGFALDDLDAGMVRVDGRNRSETDFIDGANQPCE